MIHELGHLLLNFPDLYRPAYAPWTYQDEMDGTGTHFPVTTSSILRYEMAVLDFEDIEMRSHRQMPLMSLEDYNKAYRFPCGIQKYSEGLIVENREVFNFYGIDKAPTRINRGCLVYRLDENQSRYILWYGKNRRRKTTMVTGNFLIVSFTDHRIQWGKRFKRESLTGNLLPMEAIPLLHHHWYAFSSRNSLQELWWEFSKIDYLRWNESRNSSGQAMCLDADFKAINILDYSDRATWNNQRGQILDMGKCIDRRGVVMRLNVNHETLGRKNKDVLLLKPTRGTNNYVQGKFRLPHFEGKNFRLYARFSMSKFIGRNESLYYKIIHGNKFISFLLNKRNPMQVVSMDIINYQGLTIQVKVPNNNYEGVEGGYLLDGYLVPLPEIEYDFINDAKTARWTNDRGQLLTVGPTGDSDSKGGAKPLDFIEYADGVIYGPELLKTHPRWADNGDIIARYNTMGVPNDSVLSVQIGLPSNRKTYGKAFKTQIYFIESSTNKRYNLINDDPDDENACVYFYNPSEVDLWNEPWKKNCPVIYEVYLREIQGKQGRFYFKINSAGQAAQDWVMWSCARIYKLT